MLQHGFRWQYVELSLRLQHRSVHERWKEVVHVNCIGLELGFQLERELLNRAF